MRGTRGGPLRVGARTPSRSTISTGKEARACPPPPCPPVPPPYGGGDTGTRGVLEGRYGLLLGALKGRVLPFDDRFPYRHLVTTWQKLRVLA